MFNYRDWELKKMNEISIAITDKNYLGWSPLKLEKEDLVEEKLDKLEVLEELFNVEKDGTLNTKYIVSLEKQDWLDDIVILYSILLNEISVNRITNYDMLDKIYKNIPYSDYVFNKFVNKKVEPQKIIEKVIGKLKKDGFVVEILT